MNKPPDYVANQLSRLTQMTPDDRALLAALDSLHAASNLTAERAMQHLIHQFEISREEANRVLRLWLRRLIENSGPAYGVGAG